MSTSVSLLIKVRSQFVLISSSLNECNTPVRNRIQKAADAGYIHVNNAPVKSNYKVRPEDVITLMLDRPKHDNTIEAEDYTFRCCL